jgi:hypothetical protein
MRRASKTRLAVQVAIGVALCVVTASALIMWERSGWIADMNAQCASAMPLVRNSAARDDVARTLGGQYIEYASEDLPKLQKQFGSAQNGEKIADITRWLEHDGHLWVYSKSRSIMFLYLSSAGTATHVSCFLQ